MTTREAEVVVVRDATGRAVLDFDPVNVTISTEIIEAVYRVADGADQRLIDLVDMVDEYVIDAEMDGTVLNLSIIWSDTRRVVKAFCSSCGDPFVAHEMGIDDAGLVCMPCYE